MTFYESGRKHRARLQAFAPSAALLIMVGVLAAVRVDGLFRTSFSGGVVAAAFLGIVFILAMTVGVSLFVRSIRDYRGRIRDGAGALALSVDQRGVTLHNLGARLDWSQIREIVIEQHPIPRTEQLAVGSPLRTTIVFVPMNQTAGQITVTERRLASRFQELYGSSFAVDTSTLTEGTDGVARAVQEAAPCPIRLVRHAQRSRRRPAYPI